MTTKAVVFSVVGAANWKILEMTVEEIPKDTFLA